MAANALFNVVIFSKTSTSTPQALTFSKCDDLETAPKYEFSSQDHIAALEAEVYSLKGKETQKRNAAFEGLKTRMREQEGSKPIVLTEPERRPVAQKVRPPIRDETPVPPIAPAQPNRVAEVANDPIHPFRRAPDATYAPPQNRNIAAPFRAAQPTSKRPDPAYKTLPPIHDPQITSTVYNRVLNAPVRGHSSPLPFPFHQLPQLPFHSRLLLSSFSSSVVFLTEPTAEELPFLFRGLLN